MIGPRRPAILLFVTLVLTAQLPASAHPATHGGTEPVLGNKRVFGAYGTGWGTVRPAYLATGTDCGTVISKIHWSSWGRRHAHGTGLTCPHESRSRSLVRIRLEPAAPRICPTSHRLAYSKFFVRVPNHRGGYRHKKPWLGVTNYCR